MIISGRGYEQFSRVLDRGYFRYAQAVSLHRLPIVQIGGRPYVFKHSTIARVNTQTGKRIGSVKRLEDVLKWREWAVEIG